MEVLLAASPDPRAAAAVVVSGKGQQITPLCAAASAGSEQGVKLLLDLAPESALVRCMSFGSLPIHLGEDWLCLVGGDALALQLLNWCPLAA